MKVSAEETVGSIRRKSKQRYNAEEKIRIGQEGLRGEDMVVDLCRRKAISQSLCYQWSKEFLVAL
jgi:transposase